MGPLDDNESSTVPPTAAGPSSAIATDHTSSKPSPTLSASSTESSPSPKLKPDTDEQVKSTSVTQSSMTTGVTPSSGVGTSVKDTIGSCVDQGFESGPCKAGRSAHEGAIIGEGAIAGVVMIGLLIWLTVKRCKKKGKKEGYLEGQLGRQSMIGTGLSRPGIV
ncbi:hypothetical protein IAR55_006955 [Kwoniella newhampshirensis]|uniref:Uncharacterized protein n=1 Tax=Kwoniella newhampshirensis TaxID=1651941 RepID=A0AAW0YTS5_9TREE